MTQADPVREAFKTLAVMLKQNLVPSPGQSLNDWNLNFPPEQKQLGKAACFLVSATWAGLLAGRYEYADREIVGQCVSLLKRLALAAPRFRDTFEAMKAFHRSHKRDLAKAVYTDIRLLFDDLLATKPIAHHHTKHSALDGDGKTTGYIYRFTPNPLSADLVDRLDRAVQGDDNHRRRGGRRSEYNEAARNDAKKLKRERDDLSMRQIRQTLIDGHGYSDDDMPPEGQHFDGWVRSTPKK